MHGNVSHNTQQIYEARAANKQVRKGERRKKEYKDWKKLPDAVKQARAEMVYANTWDLASQIYGAKGMPMPNAKYYLDNSEFQPGVSGQTTIATDNTAPLVNIPRNLLMALSKPKGNQKKMAKETLLHEWAHVYQTPEVLKTGRDDLSATEIGARALADYYAKKLLNIKNQANVREMPGIKKYLKEYGPGMWRKRQFGENYGKDPTTIRSQE